MSATDIPDVAGEGLAALLLDDSSRVPPLDSSRRIFVNRTLRLDRIEVIGFDMDYTLAIYKKLRIEQLAFDLTVGKLIERGYPEAIREVRYEPDRVIRGLVVEKATGRMLKMDRYGHVGRAFHGLRELTREERGVYRNTKLEIDGGGFERIDTLFSLPEACLYSHLVDWFDRQALPDAPSYQTIAEDVRSAIDEAHADGSLKQVIKADPGAYVEKSVELALALHRLRSSGKRLFVLTNSYWPYTQTIMSFLLDGVLDGYPTWRSYFDLVIVGAKKPQFFRKGEPFRRIDEARNEPVAEPATSLDRYRVYQGGNLADLETMADWKGEVVLYIGDHIYGDILLSKKSSLWRTCMIVPELEDVVWHEELYGPDLVRHGALEDEIQRTDYGINYYKVLLNRIDKLEQGGELTDSDRAALAEASRHSRAALETLRASLRTRVDERTRCLEHIERGYNPHWGRLFVEGSETSLFGQQVENWACIYTSRVSNFAHYSPVQYFRSLPERLPHERHR